MGHQVKNSGGECRHSARHKHVTELRNRRVGENFLDIGLANADGRCEQGSQSADDRDHRQRHWRPLKDDMRTRHHVDPSGDHGGRVDESRHRSWAFHSVRQPDIERKLS